MYNTVKKMNKFFLIGFLFFSVLSLSSRISALEFQVITTTEISLVANITLVKGEKSAVLIDVPFSRADAHRVVAEVLDSGKTLEAVIITHDHPDHFFGLDVIEDAFPEAKLLAHAAVVKDMTRSVPIKFERWSPMLGMNAPKRQVIPKALENNEYVLEGTPLKVLGPMQGDHIHSTVIWEPESKTLVAGDLVYNGVYVWLGEHLQPNYNAWLKSLNKLSALKPVHIIAGHTKPGLQDDSYAIEWTAEYIKTFSELAKKTNSSEELAKAIVTAYPNALDVAGGFLVGVSSQVGSKEIDPWDE